VNRIRDVSPKRLEHDIFQIQEQLYLELAKGAKIVPQKVSIHHPSAFSWHPDWKVLAGKMGRENIFNILRQLADPPSSNLFSRGDMFQAGQ